MSPVFRCWRLLVGAVVTAVAAILSVAAVGGCGPSQPVAPTPTPAAIPAKKPLVPTPLPAVAKPLETPQPTDVPAVEAAPAKVVENAPAEAPPAEPVRSIERILLLTPASPLLIELELTIDGRPHSDALEQLVDEVLQVADSDGDGRPTWKEITTSKRFLYGQYGNLPIDGSNGPKQIIELYDIDRDGLVDRTELPRFLTRNAGGSRAFSLRGTADFRASSRRDSLTWRVLDSDEDGELSAAEIAAAAARLRSRDTNDDEALVPADLNPQLAAMPGQMSPTARRRRGVAAARLLGAHANWDSVRSSLEEIYALGGTLTPDCFSLLPQLFTALDADQNGRLGKGEFQRLDTAEPQIRLAVNFGTVANPAAAGSEIPTDAPPEELPSPTQMKLLGTSDELAAAGVSAVEQAGRFTLRVAGMTISFYMNDTAGNANYEAQAGQALAMFDGDKNGYLEAGEFPEQAQTQYGRIEAVDTDADGKVYAGEIITYLRQQQAAQRCQVHAQAGDREDALFAALDTNNDERLDAREIDAAPAQLQKIDRNADGTISDEEIPAALMVGLARGSLENMAALFAPPPVVAQGPAADAPRWFTAMDASGDGVISRREFLGTRPQFEALDRNSDDFLEVSEAAQAD